MNRKANISARLASSVNRLVPSLASNGFGLVRLSHGSVYPRYFVGCKRLSKKRQRFQTAGLVVPEVAAEWGGPWHSGKLARRRSHSEHYCLSTGRGTLGAFACPYGAPDDFFFR
jgi:hypothetical protein